MSRLRTLFTPESPSFFGCGIKNCTTGSPFGPSFPNWTLVVCNYAPPGNVSDCDMNGCVLEKPY